MNPQDALKLLQFIDEFHKFIQFLLPFGLYIFFRLFIKNKQLLWILILASVAAVFAMMTRYNSLEVVSFQTGFIVTGLLLPPLFFEIFENKINPKLIAFTENSSLFFLGFFLLTQGLIGGCVIHLVQNYISLNYLRIENWHNLEIFAGNTFPSSFLKFFYIFCGLGVFLLLGRKLILKKQALQD